MISKRKGDDLSEVISGPLGYFVIGIVVIGIGIGGYGYVIPDSEDDESDDAIALFSFVTNVAGQLKILLFTIAGLVIIGGSIMTGLILILIPVQRRCNTR